MDDYFALLGLPRGFAVDLEALDAAYFARQREFHPDRFATAAPQARIEAMQKSATINDAYRILRDPLTRARYLLGEVWEKAQKADKTMLHEAMLQREALEEADSSSALERIKKDAAEKEAAALRELAAAFAEGNLVHACQLTLRLGYMHRLKDAIRMKTLAAAHA